MAADAALNDQLRRSGPRDARRNAVSLMLASGRASIALERIHSICGFATLSGVPETYFAGWLNYYGQQVPVFDLNCVLCEQQTEETFGTRIILLPAATSSPAPLLGLLAAGVTDTVAIPCSEAPLLEPDSFLPMLYALIPEVGADSAKAAS